MISAWMLLCFDASKEGTGGPSADRPPVCKGQRDVALRNRTERRLKASAISVEFDILTVIVNDVLAIYMSHVVATSAIDNVNRSRVVIGKQSVAAAAAADHVFGVISQRAV